VQFSSAPVMLEAPDIAAGDSYSTNKMSFEEAMKRAKSSQSAAYPTTLSAAAPPSFSASDNNNSSNSNSTSSNPAYDWSMMASTYGSPSRGGGGNGPMQTAVSPTVAAHINEARQRRTQFKLRDPDATAPVSDDMVKKVREDRFQRSASAPFATAESLRVKLESSATMQNTLMRLGMERTQLEADIIRLEPKARRQIDARMQKDRIEVRLGQIRKESMRLRKTLREMGM
jgi:hypothetical protein